MNAPRWNASHAKLAGTFALGLALGGGSAALKGDPRVPAPVAVPVAHLPATGSPDALAAREPLAPWFDDDQDGIPDFGDACPLSPTGTTVDTDGCPPPPPPARLPKRSPKRKR